MLCNWNYGWQSEMVKVGQGKPCLDHRGQEEAGVKEQGGETVKWTWLKLDFGNKKIRVRVTLSCVCSL